MNADGKPPGELACGSFGLSRVSVLNLLNPQTATSASTEWLVTYVAGGDTFGGEEEDGWTPESILASLQAATEKRDDCLRQIDELREEEGRLWQSLPEWRTRLQAARQGWSDMWKVRAPRAIRITSLWLMPGSLPMILYICRRRGGVFISDFRDNNACGTFHLQAKIMAIGEKPAGMSSLSSSQSLTLVTGPTVTKPAEEAKAELAATQKALAERTTELTAFREKFHGQVRAQQPTQLSAHTLSRSQQHSSTELRGRTHTHTQHTTRVQHTARPQMHSCFVFSRNVIAKHVLRRANQRQNTFMGKRAPLTNRHQR